MRAQAVTSKQTFPICYNTLCYLTKTKQPTKFNATCSELFYLYQILPRFILYLQHGVLECRRFIPTGDEL